RCVRMIAEAAASVPWLLYEGKQEMDEHPLLSLLHAPNPMQSGIDLMEEWYCHLQVSGNAFLEAVHVSQKPRELYVLRPDRVKIIPGTKGWPAGYEYEVEGKRIRFPNAPRGKQPILHMSLFHPTNDHYGMSPLEAAAVSVDIHNATSNWSKALFDNSARPSGALIYRGSDAAPNLTDEQFQRLKNELQDNYQGLDNAGRPLLLEGGLEWKPMSLTPQDLDFIDAKHAAAREIALAFGVPPMLLGIPGDNSYANYQEANRAFWRHTILPFIGKTSRKLCHWLGPCYGKNIRLWFDANKIEALSEERERLWRRIQRADFLTEEEKRRAVGYSPSPQGKSREK
ncbi:MAG: phage portal protein, partial [Parvibaculales bacterium]